MTGDTRPSLTFGVEMEMVYVHALRDFQQLTGIRTSEGVKATSKQIRDYVASILRHQLPIGFKTPSVLGNVKTEFLLVVDYSGWTVTEDASIGAGVDEISAQFNIPVDEAFHNLHWDQIELVSPIFRFRSENVWFPQLRQVQADLSPRHHLGASFCNDSCGLHVHFAVESTEPLIPGDADAARFPLLVLQHIIILWAYWEHYIELMHPFWRHPNYCEYAQSLLTSARGVEVLGTWHAWADHVYSIQSSAELRAFLSGRQEPKYIKIHISPARLRKVETLEFREHRGTTDAEEIRWWVVFIESVIQYCYRLATTDFRFFDLGSELWNVHNVEDVWHIIEMPEEGRNFLRGKIREYARLDPAEFFGSSSSGESGSGGSENNN